MIHAISFRPATLEDLPVLYQFEQGIILAERPFDSTLKPDPINYYDLKAYILSNDVEIIVALDNDVIVSSGYAKIMRGKPYHMHSKYAYLGFMYVRPEYRGKGIINGITERLKAWAKSKNLNEIRLDVYNDNHSAIKAYEKAGLKKHLVEMRMRL